MRDIASHARLAFIQVVTTTDLPVDPEEAAEDVDAGVSAVEALWRRVLDALGDRQVLEVVLLVNGLGALQQRLHIQLIHGSEIGLEDKYLTPSPE